MVRIGIIADDLTGACDAAAPFAASGRTVVELDGTPVQAAVVALSTGSRDVAAQRAGASVRLACHRLRRRGAQMIVKKIDSTLRGNLGTEIDAARTTCSADVAVVCPAFPELGRTIEGGRLRVRALPAAHGDLAGLLRRQGMRPVWHLDADSLQADPDRTAQILRRARFGAVVADARTAADLMRIAALARPAFAQILLAGSGGLLRALAPPAKHQDLAPRSARPMLLVIGTRHPATQRQVAALLRSGMAEQICLQRSPLESLRDILSEGRHVVVTDCRAVDLRLAGVVRAAVDIGIGGLVLSGGDTAAAVCRMLRVRALHITGELEIGTVRSRIQGGMAAGLTVITKSGGFGGSSTLINACRALSYAGESGYAWRPHHLQNRKRIDGCA